MGIRVLENFLNLTATDANMKYPSGNFGIGAGGRWGGNCYTLANNNAMFPVGANLAEFWFGFAWKTNGFGNIDTFCKFMDGATSQIQLGMTAAGQYTCNRAGTVLGTTAIPAGLVIAGTWHYYEIRSVIHNTIGTFVLKIDGVTYLNLSGIDTQQSTNAYMNAAFMQGGVSTTGFVSDVYLDDAGFLGDIFVGSGIPSTNGDTNNFTPSAGLNFQNVDETTQDGDVTYNSSATVGHVELYNMPDVVFTGGVGGVALTVWARKDDAGARSIRLIVKSGITIFESADVPLGNTYQPYQWMLATDPNTTAPWLQANYNTAQFGVKVVL